MSQQAGTTPTAILRFIELVQTRSAPHLGEYLLWEFLEGLRKQAFPVFGPLSEEDCGHLKFLRDELKVWPFYQAPVGWQLAPIDGWREHARAYGSREAFMTLQKEVELERQQHNKPRP